MNWTTTDTPGRMEMQQQTRLMIAEHRFTNSKGDTGMNSNAERVEYARCAVELHTDLSLGEDDNIEIAILDLLANLRHLAFVEGVNFDRLLRTSAMHFEAEQGG